MKRLTTNCPDNNLDAALNLFYIKDFETWVRGGGDGPDYPDIRLYDFIRKAAKILLPDLDFPMDDDGVDYAMGELLLDGPDEPTGLLALLYTAAWTYAELRGRLMQYEDTGLMPEEITAMQHTLDEYHKVADQLLRAQADGRLVVLPCKVGDTVYVINRHLGQIFANTVISISVGNSTDLKNYIRTKWVGEKGNESIRKWTLRQVGRYVFLSREEAEKALEAMQDGN